MFSIVGGASVPAAGFGRMNATWPLAVLSFDNERIRLRLRGPARWMWRTEQLDAGRSDVQEVYACGRFLSRGIGVRHKNGHDFYFWTGHAEEILEDLSAAGLHVTIERRRPSKIWRGDW